MKTMKRLFRSALVALGLSALAVGSAFAASNIEGFIQGEVMTTDGEPVANATVTVINQGTSFTRSTNTDAEGDFRFSSLGIGVYTIRVEAPGFQTATREANVNVGVGTDAVVRLLREGQSAADLGTVTVTGATISPIDITSTESSTNLGEAQIDRLPVARNVTAIALLAPGTTKGDSAFGNLASFGGSTVGENVCYINGLNVTNFRNGLGCSTVPFEFYKEFQLKTGGYSAEFGRSTGGVINAVTKSGTNEFKWGVNLYWEPWIDDLNGTAPDVFSQDGELVGSNTRDEDEGYELNLYASGPIIKDKLFYYVLFSPRNDESRNLSAGAAFYDRVQDQLYGSYTETSSDDAFWGVKLDYLISNDHQLELTAFSDAETFTRDYYLFEPAQNPAPGDYNAGTVGRYDSSRYFDQGGQNVILKYTGYLTDDFTLSIQGGQNKYDLSTNTNVDDVATVLDYTVADVAVDTTALATGSISGSEDTRTAYRVDADWYLGDHTLRFGLDYETLESWENSYYTGIQSDGFGDPNNSPDEMGGHLYEDFGGGGSVILNRVYVNRGSFETISNAIYIEDKWQVNDKVMLSLGLRNETFKSKNKVGEEFIDVSNQIAPRLGVAWDALGDGSMKVFANFGRYYLPVATNTNARLAGDEYYWFDLTTASGFDPQTGEPINQTCLACPYLVASDGELKPTDQIVDQDIDPMYQDEFIVGFMKEVGAGWSVGMRGIYRELGSTLEDITLDQALRERGIPFSSATYVLTNPGTDVTVYYDTDNNASTPPELITFTAKELGYPESIRKYSAIEFLFEKVWNGEWFLQGSYTWAHSYGNNEGYVRSDNGQTDAGLTTLFDYPGLLDGAYGNLPNDRRHALKIFGAWRFVENWQLSANLLMESGRPINAFGVHPTDPDAAAYGSESFFRNGELIPRGSLGTTPFTSRLDLGIKYFADIGEGDMTLGLDVFNVFNSVNATEVDEVAEEDLGIPNPTYGVPTAFQTPRYIRLSAEFAF